MAGTILFGVEANPADTQGVSHPILFPLLSCKRNVRQGAEKVLTLSLTVLNSPL